MPRIRNLTRTRASAQANRKSGTGTTGTANLSGHQNQSFRSQSGM